MADMPEEKIVLDRRSFEALAVDSRVRILKSLKERRKTLSEISQEQGMSVSGVKEHLENLEAAGLIKKIDDGHKWKYYELTRKGSDIVAPKELKVWILLSASMLGLVASVMAIFMAYNGTGAGAGRNLPEMAPAPSSAGAEIAKTTALNATQGSPDLAVPIAVVVISLFFLAGCVLILLRNRQKKPISP